MERIELTYKNDKEVGGEITFDPIPAGKTTRKELYIKNISDWKLNIKMGIDDDNVSIIDYPKELESEEKDNIILKYSPSLKVEKPVEAELSINYSWVVS